MRHIHLMSFIFMEVVVKFGLLQPSDMPHDRERWSGWSARRSMAV